MRSRALNIVIKLASVDGAPCVKLSDDPSKASPAPFPPFSLLPLFLWFFACPRAVLTASTSGVQNTGDPETVARVKELYGLP